MKKLSITPSGLKAQPLVEHISMACIALALIGAYLPGRPSSFFIVPALIVLCWHHKLVQIDKKILWPFWSLLAYLLFFTVFSENHSRSADGVYQVLRGLIFFPLGLIYALLAKRRGTLWVNLLAVVCIAGNLLFERHYTVANGSSYLFFSYYINPNNAGVHLTGLLVLTLPLLASNGRRSAHWCISATGAAMGLILLLMTNARGAWLGVAGGIVILLWFKKGMPKWVRLTLGVSAASGLCLLLVFANQKGFALSLRGGLWTGLLNSTIQENLLMGYGIDLVKELILKKDLITVSAHNILLEIFICSGLIGLIWIGTIVFFLVRHLMHFSYQQNALWCMGILGIMIFLIMGQFDLKFYSFRFIASLSFFLGLIYSQRVTITREGRMSNGG